MFGSLKLLMVHTDLSLCCLPSTLIALICSGFGLVVHVWYEDGAELSTRQMGKTVYVRRSCSAKIVQFGGKILHKSALSSVLNSRLS